MIAWFITGALAGAIVTIGGFAIWSVSQWRPPYDRPRAKIRRVAELKLVIDIPELEVLMADVQRLLADVRGLKTDISSRLDSIDDVIETLRAQVEAGQVDAATLDQISSEVSSARQSLESVDPEDPSGDDPAAPPDEPPAQPAG